jgi:hypothetical protein
MAYKHRSNGNLLLSGEDIATIPHIQEKAFRELVVSGIKAKGLFRITIAEILYYSF